MFFTLASFNALSTEVPLRKVSNNYKTKLQFMLMIAPDLYSLKQVVFPKFKFSKQSDMPPTFGSFLKAVLEKLLVKIPYEHENNRVPK